MMRSTSRSSRDLFTAIPSKYSRSRFLHEPPSDVPVDTQ